MTQRAASGAAPVAASCGSGVDSLMLVMRIGQSPERRTGEQSNALASPARSYAAGVAFTPASGRSSTPSQAPNARECEGAPLVDCSAVGERGLCRQHTPAAAPSTRARLGCAHNLDADRLARRCGPTGSRPSTASRSATRTLAEAPSGQAQGVQACTCTHSRIAAS